MTEAIILVSFIGFLIFAYIIMAIIFLIIDKIDDYKNRKFEQKYPEYVSRVIQYNQNERRNIAYNNDNIAPIIREIKSLEQECKLLPIGPRTLKENQIEQLKCKLYDYEMVYKENCKALETERKILQEMKKTLDK